MKPVWTMPVASTALQDGVVFEKLRRRQVALRFSYEDEDADDVHQRTATVTFDGVEAFKCTYHYARDEGMLAAYDQLTDLGQTSWLREVSQNLQRNGVDDASGLTHLMINFDDGPCYEVICRRFEVSVE